MEEKRTLLSDLSEEQWEQIEKRVFNFVKDHPDVSIHTIAQSLGLKEPDAFHVTYVLLQKQFLLSRHSPLGNEKDPQCSDFFSVRKTEYTERR